MENGFLLTMAIVLAVLLTIVTVWLIKSERKRTGERIKYQQDYSDLTKIMIEEVEKLEVELTKEKKLTMSYHREQAEVNRYVVIMETIFAAVAHDLKSYLVNIHRISDEEQAAGEMRSSLRMIKNESKNALNFAKGMLTSFRKGEGAAQLTVQKFSPYSLLQDIRRELLRTEKYQEYKIVVEIAEKDQEKTKVSLDNFVGSEILMRFVMNNFINNAREAEPEDKTVSIIIESEAEDKVNFLKFTIHNLGEIPESIQGSFLNSVQKSTKGDGSGLGAFLSTMFFKFQGGKINFISKDNRTAISIAIPIKTFKNQAY